MLTESARFYPCPRFLLNLPMSVPYLSDASVWCGWIRLTTIAKKDKTQDRDAAQVG